MEEYLANMKRLLSHMDDIEEAAAKSSVEEQRQRTRIRCLEDDLKLVTAEKKRLNEEGEEMVKGKRQVLTDIAEKQKKISSLENESSTLSQTLELLRQEISSEVLKHSEKRLLYTKSCEELNAKLQNWQDWLNKHKKMLESAPSVEEAPSKQTFFEGTTCSVVTPEGDLDKLPALVDTDLKALEEEHKALLSDKAGEAEYYQSLQNRVNEIKSISDTIKCQCGFEYKVQFIEEAKNCS
ncbi:uncharacterized protein [Typha angustifolia]|uniref:uncharacterized protein isoform X2 n=1 Tax=Typha angustifolia TaxID=59011 RepID=UPI003C308FC4